MLSEATEMYLITIYRLTDETPMTTIGEIADRLGIHHSSASEKIKHLVEQHYAQYEPQAGVSLTDTGRRIAVSVIRKHRLIKTFLVNMAGYPIDEIYDEACSLEHAISDRLADSLEKMLDYPEVDPHGYPIPSKDGTVANIHYKTLNDYTQGAQVIIRRIEALHQGKLSYLRQLGLVPGVALTIADIAPFNGPLTLQLGDDEVVIAPSLAQEIEVSPLA